jgi:hypothetical protein
MFIRPSESFGLVAGLDAATFMGVFRKENAAALLFWETQQQ